MRAFSALRWLPLLLMSRVWLSSPFPTIGLGRTKKLSFRKYAEPTAACFLDEGGIFLCGERFFLAGLAAAGLGVTLASSWSDWSGGS